MQLQITPNPTQHNSNKKKNSKLKNNYLKDNQVIRLSYRLIKWYQAYALNMSLKYFKTLTIILTQFNIQRSRYC